MHVRTLIAASAVLCSGVVTAQAPSAASQLTIYNDGFAVVRTTVPLNLHKGENDVSATGVTQQVEPDSVVLRDAVNHRPIAILEQNYDAGVVSREVLLQKFEGKTIDYQVTHAFTGASGGQRMDFPEQIGKVVIIRADNQPIFDVNGHIQFSEPGMLLFPDSTNDLLLKPTLRWKIASDKDERFPAELDYITQGFSWQASYNLIVSDKPDVTAAEQGQFVGWVTMKNDSGTEFRDATIQLMAGDVAKIRPISYGNGNGGMILSSAQSVAVMGATEKPFDDFHLYDLHRSTSLLNHETKQVQFLDAADVTAQRSYRFDGNNVMTFNGGYFNTQQYLNDTSDKRVRILEEVQNTTANKLGIPLPSGRLRLYRQQTSGQMQFVGEAMVPHTPADQPISITSGYAFDLTADRRQTDFHVENGQRVLDESFETVFSNAKGQPVTIHAVEHMNRGRNWEIMRKSGDFIKRDSTSVDFATVVPAHGKATLTYTVHYTW